jgi:ribosome biogenesis protein MAK21
MAKGGAQKETKVPTPATNNLRDGGNPKQSQPLNTEAFSDLSRKIQAQFDTLNSSTKNQKRKQIKQKGGGSKQVDIQAGDREGNGINTQSRGRKRDSQGVVKGQQPSTRPIKNDNSAQSWKLSFEKEVYALGGTADDLALVDGIDSGSEAEVDHGTTTTSSNSNFDKGLRKGIQDILKQIENVGRPDESGEEEDQSEEEDSDMVPVDVGRPSNRTVNTGSRSNKDNLLMQPRPDWFNSELPHTKIVDGSRKKVLPKQVQQLHEHAQALLEAENEVFKASQQFSSSQNFYSTVIASGTLSDKISALTLAVQESPLHNMRALETLINLGKKRSRAQAVDVLRALKDLFAQGSLLPSDRKLHAFQSNSDLLNALSASKHWSSGQALPGGLQPQHLIMWTYESWLKEKYFEVIETLEVWCNDEIEFSKSKAVTFVYELLKEKPEQESNLLRLLTNKLGDPVKKIASQTSYLLMQLMAAHPLMKMTILASIESDLLFRPGQTLHAKYFAAITLNQTILSAKEEEVASKLLQIYFSLFVGLLKPANDHKPKTKEGRSTPNSGENHEKKWKMPSSELGNAQNEDLKEKLISAILTGINRAYPYTSSTRQRYVHPKQDSINF